MQLLVHHQKKAKNGALQDGLVWIPSVIAQHLRCEDVESVLDALHWLRAKGWIEKRGNEWVKTDYGEDEFKAEIRKTQLPIDQHNWITEAREGMTQAGRQTSIENPVIPGKEPHYCKEDAMLDTCDRIGWLKQLAKHLGLSVEETSRCIESGKIRQCKGTETRQQHFGIFNRNGKGWRHLCRECMAELHRDYRMERKAK